MLAEGKYNLLFYFIHWQEMLKQVQHDSSETEHLALKELIKVKQTSRPVMLNLFQHLHLFKMLSLPFDK
jgi:hypothetical protein